MKFKILIITIVLCLSILGCVEEKNKFIINKIPTITPTENIEIKQKQITPTAIQTTLTPELVTVTATPKITEKRVFQNLTNSEQSKTAKAMSSKSILQYELETPSDTEYEWIDLNESLKTVNINGITYETGLLGKMYIPKEIKPDREYPIYIVFSRNPGVSELAIAGVTLCISPSFVIDLLNKRFDLYVHLGIGGVFGKYFWDRYTKHWFIRNIYSESGFNLSCKIDSRLYTLNLSDLKPGEWQVYKIYLNIKTPKKNPKIAFEQSIKTELELLSSESYNGEWIPIQDDKIGVWVRKIGDNLYLAKLYMNELNFRVCAPGLGIVFSYPPELWVHASFGINNWDSQLLPHIPIAGAEIQNQSLISTEKLSESSWKRVDVFKVRFDNSKSYITNIETIENGNFKGIAISNEELVQWIYPTLYCVKVRGTLTIDDKYQKSINTTLYYTEKKGFKKGDEITGFVKLITIKTTEKPINYLSAIGERYYINKLQTTPTPKLIPILDISAPEIAQVGEEVEITVYSNCYTVNNQSIVCTYSSNPISDALIVIEKDGIVVETGKTDENGLFKTIFDKAGEYTITASKEGYIPATTKITVYEYVTSITTPEESPIEQITVPQITVPEVTPTEQTVTPEEQLIISIG